MCPGNDKYPYAFQSVSAAHSTHEFLPGRVTCFIIRKFGAFRLISSYEEIIRLRGGRILNIKVQRMGGLFASRRAHDLAQSAGIPCWMGTMPELGIASAQGLLHLAAAATRMVKERQVPRPHFSHPFTVSPPPHPISSRHFRDIPA